MTRTLRSLVGRAAEIDALYAVLAEARSGSARIAVVEGEPGIGKSRVLREAVGMAHDLGFRVMWGGCDEMEQDRPLRALAEALEVGRTASGGTSDELAILLASSARPAGSRDQLFAADAGWLITEAVLDALEELASAGPVVLAVEDLQWADPLTLRAVRAIGRQLVHIPLATLVTLRAGAHEPAVDRATVDLLDRGAERLVLAPLDLDDAVQLATELLGRPPGPRLTEQVAGAGGNPLFVIELLLALDAEGAIALVNGEADAQTSSLPPTLILTLLRRLSLVPEEVLNLLRLASVLGSAFSLGELAALADRTVAQLLPRIVAARDAGLLVEAGDRLAFRHDLVRQAIFGDLPIAVRKGLHRQAGHALAAAGASVERIAGHVALGADAGDAEAVRWLRQAAQQSAHRDPVTAVRLLERALELVDTTDARDEIQAEMIELLISSGRLRDAETVAREVLARPLDPAVQLMTRTALASTLSIGARYPESIDQLERAAGVAAEWERQSLAGARSVLMVLSGRLADAVDCASAAIGGGERIGNDHARCLGLQALSMVALAGADVQRAVAVAEQAVNVREQSSAPWVSHVVPELWLGTALADGDRLTEAEATLQMGRFRAERSGDVARLPLYHWAIAEVRLAIGQWDDAQAEVESGLALVEGSTSHVGDVFAYAIEAHLALHRGQLEVAEAAVREADTALVAGPLEVGFEWMSWVRALLQEARGDPSGALATLSNTWDLIAPLRYLQAASRPLAADLVRLALAAGDRGRAVEVAFELESSAARAAVPTALGLALRCRGLLADDPELLVAAVETHRRSSRPLLLAGACEDAGIAFGRQGRVNDALPLLDEALVSYERLGAEWDAARLRGEQRTLGFRQRHRAAPRPTFGWNSLTPTESKVVALVAEGLTNRQVGERLFMSRRTVATHVEHVLRKLGHANRVELAADAIRRSVIAPSSPGGRPAPEAGRANPRTSLPGHRPG